MSTLPPTVPAFRYDPDADALDIDFSSEPAPTRCRELGATCFAHYDLDGGLRFLELLHVSRGVDLSGMPEADAVRAVLDQVALDQGWAARATA